MNILWGVQNFIILENYHLIIFKKLYIWPVLFLTDHRWPLISEDKNWLFVQFYLLKIIKIGIF